MQASVTRLLCLALLRGGNQQWGAGRTKTGRFRERAAAIWKRRCRVRDVDTIPAPKEPTEPVHDRVLLPSSCSPLAAAGQWDRAGRCTWIMQQHLVRRRRAVSQTAGTESRGPRPPGAPSGAWSLLAVRRPTGKRNALNPPGGKPGAWQHVAEVPVSLSFSTGRADVLRMGWGGGGVRGLTSARVCTGRNVRRRGDSSVAAKVSPLAIALEAERLHLCASQRTNPSPKQATDCALTRQRKWKRILN